MKHSRGSLLMGIPSLLLIFAVLTMVTLSLMTYGTARSNFKSSETALEQTLAYYEASNHAAELTQTLNRKLGMLQTSSPDRETFTAALPELAEGDISWQQTSGQYEILLPYSESQGLHVSLLPQNQGVPLVITDWSSVLISDWEPDTSLPLYHPDTP